MKQLTNFLIQESKKNIANLSFEDVEYVLIDIEGEQVITFKSEQELLDYDKKTYDPNEDEIKEFKDDLSKLKAKEAMEYGGMYDGGIIVKLQ